jgi:hypothetical protein
MLPHSIYADGVCLFFQSVTQMISLLHHQCLSRTMKSKYGIIDTVHIHI